jgi:hypothetical protein
VDWINLVQGRDRWQAVVNTVIEPLDSTKCGEFLDLLSDYQLLKKDSNPWS